MTRLVTWTVAVLCTAVIVVVGAIVAFGLVILLANLRMVL